MAETRKLFDVIAVNIDSRTVRVMTRDLAKQSAEAYVERAVHRLGVNEEFFTETPAGTYRDGDVWGER